MLFLSMLLMLECLSSAVLMFQFEQQVIMHSILGGLHILACLGLLVMVFARVHSPLLIAHRHARVFNTVCLGQYTCNGLY